MGHTRLGVRWEMKAKRVVSTICFPAPSLALFPGVPVLMGKRALKLPGSCWLTLLLPRRSPQNAGQCRGAHGSLPLCPRCLW